MTSPSAIQEAMWEAARRGEVIKKIPIDKIMGAQEVECGSFKAPDVPSQLMMSNKMLETDNMLKGTHQQNCALALVLVNDIVAKLRDSVAAGEGLSVEETQDLASELSDVTTRPFALAFRVLASK